MKKKVLIPVITAVVVAIVSIVVFAGSTVNSPNGGNNVTPPSSNGNGNGNGVEPPPETSNWVSPGKLPIEGYEPGKTVRLEIEVHNGHSIPTEFSIDYRYPDYVEEGYSKPTGVSDWVKVKEKFPVIGAQETYTAVVWLHMPSDAESPGDKWEFWIGVIDKSQAGMVITELAVRVLVTMQ